MGENYKLNEACTITAPAGVTIVAERFETEADYDTLTVNGIPFSGAADGLTATVLQAGLPIFWSSDGEETKTGWKICMHGFHLDKAGSNTDVASGQCAVSADRLCISSHQGAPSGEYQPNVWCLFQVGTGQTGTFDQHFSTHYGDSIYIVDQNSPVFPGESLSGSESVTFAANSGTEHDPEVEWETLDGYNSGWKMCIPPLTGYTAANAGSVALVEKRTTSTVTTTSRSPAGACCILARDLSDPTFQAAGQPQGYKQDQTCAEIPEEVCKSLGYWHAGAGTTCGDVGVCNGYDEETCMPLGGQGALDSTLFQYDGRVKFLCVTTKPNDPIDEATKFGLAGICDVKIPPSYIKVQMWGGGGGGGQGCPARFGYTESFNASELPAQSLASALLGGKGGAGAHAVLERFVHDGEMLRVIVGEGGTTAADSMASTAAGPGVKTSGSKYDCSGKGEYCPNEPTAFLPPSQGAAYDSAGTGGGFSAIYSAAGVTPPDDFGNEGREGVDRYRVRDLIALVGGGGGGAAGRSEGNGGGAGGWTSSDSHIHFSAASDGEGLHEYGWGGRTEVEYDYGNSTPTYYTGSGGPGGTSDSQDPRPDGYSGVSAASGSLFTGGDGGRVDVSQPRVTAQGVDVTSSSSSSTSTPEPRRRRLLQVGYDDDDDDWGYGGTSSAVQNGAPSTAPDYGGECAGAGRPYFGGGGGGGGFHGGGGGLAYRSGGGGGSSFVKAAEWDTYQVTAGFGSIQSNTFKDSAGTKHKFGDGGVYYNSESSNVQAPAGSHGAVYIEWNECKYAESSIPGSTVPTVKPTDLRETLQDKYYDFAQSPLPINMFQYYPNPIKRQPNSVESTTTYVMDFDTTTVWQSTDHVNPLTIEFAFEMVQGRVPVNTFGIFVDPTQNSTIKTFEIQAADDFAGFSYAAVGSGTVDLNASVGWQYFEIPVTLASHVKVQVGSNWGHPRVTVNEMMFGVSEISGDAMYDLAVRFDPADLVDDTQYTNMGNMETVCTMQAFPYSGKLNADYASWVQISPRSGGCSTVPTSAFTSNACDDDESTMAYISPEDSTTTFAEMYFQFEFKTNPEDNKYHILDVVEILSKNEVTSITQLDLYVQDNPTNKFTLVGKMDIETMSSWTSFAIAAQRVSAARIYVVSTQGSSSATLPEIRFFSRKSSLLNVAPSWRDRPVSCTKAKGFSYDCLVSYCPSPSQYPELSPQCFTPPALSPRVLGNYHDAEEDSTCCMTEKPMSCIIPAKNAPLNVKIDWNTATGLTANIASSYRLGTQYAIDGPSLRRDELFVNYKNKAEKIIYRVEMRGIGSTVADKGTLEDMFCTAPNTGKTIFTPAKEGQFEAKMYGLDIDGSNILVFKWGFTVVKKSFGLQQWWSIYATANASAFVHAGAVTYMYVEDDITVASPCTHYVGKKTCARGLYDYPYGAEIDESSTSSKGYSDITYTIAWENRTFPGESSFLVDTDSGLVKGTPTVAGNYTLNLMASDAAGTQAKVMAWRFEVAAIPEDPTNWTVVIVTTCVGVVLLAVSIGLICYARNLKDEFALAMTNRNDPLSKIEQFIAANREKLSDSVRVTGQFKQEFDILFVKTCMSHFNANPGALKALRDLHNKITVAARLRTKTEDPLQPDLGLNTGRGIPDAKQMQYLEQILGLIRKEEPLAADKLQNLADRHDAAAGNGPIEIHRGPVKTLDRILEKCDLKGRHFEVIRDYARASIIVGHVEQVANVLAELESGTDFEIVRCKNRLDPTYDSITSGGYRDYQLVTRVSGEEFQVKWLYEIQIMTREFYNLKMGNDDPNSAAAAHRAYKDFRRYKELGLRMQVQLDNMHKELKVLDSGYKNVIKQKGSIAMQKGEKANAQEIDSSFIKGGNQKDKAKYLWNLTAKLSSSKPFSVGDGQTVTKRKVSSRKKNQVSPKKEASVSLA